MSVLPSGTTTFLFTDIEGSTPLWERDPKAMKFALVRHHAILRQAIESCHGHVFQIVGDSFQAAFAHAGAALAAALEAQRGLAQEPWSETGPLRVRMGLHTGLGEPLEHDYASNHTLNRVARVMSAAYGEQILLSQETAELVRRDLPAGVSLKDLGEHRLKGFSRPEHLFQVLAPGLREDFPLLAARIEAPNNLPVQLTSFVGREAEIVSICEQLLEPEVRLLTLTGVGGTGKTRLSLQVGREVLDEFPDGVFFVPLASLREAHLVIPTIAETLGLRESPHRSFFDLLREYVTGRQLLLILDNFEQILEAGPLLSELLAAGLQLKILITSRALLRLAAEHDHPVAPLSLPEMKSAVSLGEIEKNEAIQLFVQRARAVKPDFRMTSENAAAVAEICRRLDGLPLAIELAAARCRLFTPQKMLDQLGSRLQLLVGGARDLPARHQTMRAAIDWSYGLLSVEEQSLFRRLAVFAGGCYLEAVEAVGASNGDGVINLLESLLDKNLILQSETEAEPRFGMYETLREYGLELLDASGESQAVLRAYADYYVKLDRQYDRDSNMANLDIELDNLRAVLRWSIASGQVEPGLSIISNFIFWGEHCAEGRRWAAELLALPNAQVRTTDRFFAVYSDAALAYFQGDDAAVRARKDELLVLAQDIGDPRLFNYVQFAAGMLLLAEGDYSSAYLSFSELGKMATEEKNWVFAGYCLFTSASAMVLMKDYDRAHHCLESARDLFQQTNELYGLMEIIIKMGYVALEKMDYVQAKILFQEGMERARAIGTRRRFVSCILGFAGIALGVGDLVRSACLFGAAEAMAKVTGSGYGVRDETAIDARNLAALGTRLDEKTFGAAWQEGMQMTFEELLAYALEGTQ